MKKKRDEKLEEIKIITMKLAESSNRDQPNSENLIKLLQESSRFIDELKDILTYTDSWDKAFVSSKSLSNFNLPPAHITLKELVIFVKRELGVS